MKKKLKMVQQKMVLLLMGNLFFSYVAFTGGLRIEISDQTVPQWFINTNTKEKWRELYIYDKSWDP